jgi:iron complex transport system substrate-binding protein
MRIVSLLPSATEILFALGFDDEIVGVSHECDFPARAKTKKVVIHSRIAKDLPPDEIDRIVREMVHRGESLYAVDAELLEELAPDLIVTQDLCHVCAASPDDLATALARFSSPPEVLCLSPQDLGDVWRDILWVGEETGRRERAQSLIEMIGRRLGEVTLQLEDSTERPRVALLEWMRPLYIGGHWVSEMIALAGGVDVLGEKNVPSRRVTPEQVIDAAPDVLLIAPCGYGKEKARAEYLSQELSAAWQEMPAVRNGRVFAFDANSYISRPGPRLVTGIAAIAKAIRPEIVVRPGVEGTFGRIVGGASRARSATG